LNRYQIPIWIMEPVRGGKLAFLAPEQEEALRAIRPNASIASWALRYLEDIPGVQMILSGMSNIAQMQDNLNTFSQFDPISCEERDLLHSFAESMKDSVPCTSCRYCTEHCPLGLDIPMLLGIYNELRINPVVNVSMRIEALPAEKQPTACIGCGACKQMCPQHIDIPDEMERLSGILATIPTWVETCRLRDEAAKRARGE